MEIRTFIQKSEQIRIFLTELASVNSIRKKGGKDHVCEEMKAALQS